MTQEEKDLLLRDLSARLPYGFTIHRFSDNVNIKIDDIGDFAHFLEYSEGEEFKPYLRPMDSMTEEEIFQLGRLTGAASYNMLKGNHSSLEELLTYVYKNHIDYFNFIPMGLALEAPKDMYKID